MFLPASQRLFRALLFEMASGNHRPGQRFLSHRVIMRNWKVSATTANLALALLREHQLVEVSDRSGHYLAADFREKALTVLAEDGQESHPTPFVKGRDLRGRLIGNRTEAEAGVMRIGVLLLTPLKLPKVRPRTPSHMALDVAAASTARGIYVMAEENRNRIDFVACHASEADEERALQRLSHSAPDGVVVLCRVSGHQIANIAQVLLKRLIPVVAVFDDCEETEMISVNFNNIGMGVNAAELFFASGHQRAGVLVPRTLSKSTMDRAHGFMLAFNRHGAEAPTLFTIDMDAPPEECLAVAEEVRKSGITALYSVGHELTEALLCGLTAAGISVPDQLSVLSSSCTPHVQTKGEKVSILHMDFEAMGRIAYRALTDFRKGEISQKCYLVNPPHFDHGSVSPLTQPQ